MRSTLGGVQTGMSLQEAWTLIARHRNWIQIHRATTPGADEQYKRRNREIERERTRRYAIRTWHDEHEETVA